MTEPCSRFDDEALLLLEEGRPLPAHFATCADCLRAQADYQKIRAGLEQPLPTAPRPGWEAEVLQAIERAPAPGAAPRRWVRWSALGAALAAAAVLLAVRAQRGEGELAIVAELEQGAATLRGAGAHPGDRLALRARAGRARFAELRVWRDDRTLVMRCAPQTATAVASGDCSRRGAALLGSFRLPSPGSFQAYLAAADAQLPEPAQTLADDTARLLAAGARVVLAGPVRAE